MERRYLRIALLLTAAATIAACTPSHREVDNPLIEAATSMTMDIPRVEMTDSTTVLHVDLYGYPDMKVRLDSTSVLKAGNETYAFKRAEGFTMNKWVKFPKTGLISFTMTFQPIPMKSKTMDFIESGDGFKLFGIDLTGKAKYPEYPAGLPDELRGGDSGGEVPGQVLKCGTSTVRVHLLGLREGMGRTVKLHMQPLLGATESLSAEANTETGTAEFSFMQYGTIKVSTSALQDAGVYSHVWIEPGQTTDVYVDLGKTGRLLVERRAIEKSGEYQFFNYMCPAYTTGRYAALNHAYTHLQDEIRMEVRPEAGISADDYAAMVEQAYAAAIDSVRHNSGMTELQKRYNEMLLDMELMQTAFSAPRMMAAAKAANGTEAEPEEITPEHIRRMLRPIGFDDMKYAIDGLNFIFSTTLCDPAWADKAQLAEDNFYREYDEAWQLFSAASSDRLTDEGRTRLERFAHPFFREACLTAESEIRAAAAAAEGRIRIERTPDASGDKLFDAIAERYAGKVVFVDFWNTWCTWCHVGFENFEPLKGGDLADKVVWLYIADESSPIAVYKKTVAGLDGEHYRVTEKQMEAIAEKLGFDGFPFYMIIGRDGTRDTRSGLEYPATAEKRLREELQK